MKIEYPKSFFELGREKMVKELNEWEKEHISEPLINWIKGLGSDIWNWFVSVTPDLMGYATIGTGAFIIIGSMIGKNSMMKTAGFYFGGLVLTICIRMGV